jgi:hypothetical protein
MLKTNPFTLGEPRFASSRSHRVKRMLETNERISEVRLGLIIVLTFTGPLSLATAGRHAGRATLSVTSRWRKFLRTDNCLCAGALI